MKHTKKDGFGLIELLIAILATAMLVIAVGNILVFTWRGWRQSSDAVSMQRDASLALRAIAREIRQTPIGDITTGTDTLSCGTRSFSKSGRVLTYEGIALIDGWVTSFVSSEGTVNGSVDVTLGIGAGADRSTIEATFYTRN